jgi:C4-dicarboxylate transporter DctQ subunit
MFARVINHLEEGIISLLLVTMTLIVFVEIVLRYVFGVGLLWAEEVTLHLSGWLVLFGASYGVKVGCHINVDTIVRLMPAKWQRIVTLLAVALSLVYCALILEGSWVYLEKLLKYGIKMQDVPIPKYVAHSILLIGFVLLAIRLLEVGWKVFKGEADGFQTSDEAKEALKLMEEEKRAEEEKLRARQPSGQSKAGTP